MNRHVPAKRSNQSKTEITRTYAKGKKLFGKLTGTFVFRRKATEDKKRQLKLKL